MDTKIIRNFPMENSQIILSALPEDHDIYKAVECIKNGGLVAFPTETVYGLGCDAFNRQAVNEVYKVKGRPRDNPLIVHLSRPEQIGGFVKEISSQAQVLIDCFMPGPITLVFEKSEDVLLKSGSNPSTIALRVPHHPVGSVFLKLADIPVAAPSANISGSPSPTKAAHVMDDFSGKIPFIIDGGQTRVGLESTVVDVTGEIPVILRPGGVSKEDIQRAGLDVIFGGEIFRGEVIDTPVSPGMKYRHYSPAARVVIVEASDSIDDYVERFMNEIEILEKKLGSGNRPAVDLMAKDEITGDKSTISSLMMSDNIDKITGDKSTISSHKGDKTGVAVFAGSEIIKSITDKIDESISLKNIEIIPFDFGNYVDAKSASNKLFDSFRQADHLNVDTIIVQGFKEEGIGTAYMNRLKKAAGVV